MLNKNDYLVRVDNDMVLITDMKNLKSMTNTLSY